MIIETIHQDKTQIDYEKYYRNAVPFLLRFPMDISLKILGIQSYSSICDSNNIDIKTHDIGLNPENLSQTVLLVITVIPKLIAISLVLLLYKWIDLNHVKYKSNSNELISSETLDSIRVEFENTSDRFFFGRNVNRRARNYIRVIGERNIREANQYIIKLNHFELNEYNIDNNRGNSFIINRFNCNKNMEQIILFTNYLCESRLLNKVSATSFIRLFDFENNTCEYVPFAVITWKGFDQDLMYMFLMLIHFNILPSQELNDLSPRLEKYFHNRFGGVIENIRKPKSRFQKDNLYLEAAILPCNDNQRMILKAMIKSFLVKN